MDKRGLIGLFALTFIFMLFLLFMFLKSTGFVEVTGYTVADGQFSVSEIIFTKLEYDDGDLVPADGDFGIYDNVGCVVDYSGSNSTNLSIGFYSAQNSLGNPNEVYANIFNNTFEDITCSEDANGKACLAKYNITSYSPGEWKCFTTWNSDQVMISDSLEMENKVPVLVKNIGNINLNIDGSYSNDKPIDLDDYFKDLEGVDLQYGAIGQKYLVIEVEDNGDVLFTNPGNYEGFEYIKFRAHDGIDGTFSNNVSVKVGEGVVDVLQVCNSIWDCNWAPCIGVQQRCVYYDKNNCGHDENKPNDLIQPCANDVGIPSGQGTKPIELTGTLEITKPLLNDTKKTLLLMGLVVLILAVLGFGSYLLFRKKEKVELREPIREAVVRQGGVQQTGQVVNLSDLYRYIETALQQGQQPQNIKQDLAKAGWQQRDIDAGFNYMGLKRFVAEKLKSGFGKEKIVESLKAKGWKDDLINSVFRELQK